MKIVELKYSFIVLFKNKSFIFFISILGALFLLCCYLVIKLCPKSFGATQTAIRMDLETITLSEVKSDKGKCYVTSLTCGI